MEEVNLQAMVIIQPHMVEDVVTIHLPTMAIPSLHLMAIPRTMEVPHTEGPEDITPETTAPEDITPETTAPGDITPETIAPGDITPETIAPGDITREATPIAPLEAGEMIPADLEITTAGALAIMEAEAMGLQITDNRAAMAVTEGMTIMAEETRVHGEMTSTACQNLNGISPH